MTALARPEVSDHPAHSLPRLGRHAPVLRRGHDEWQVGVDPARALIFSGPGFTVLLRGLVAHRPWVVTRAASLQAGLTALELDEAVVALDRAGLLEPPLAKPPADEPTRSRVRLIGAGPILGALAEHLLCAGIGEVLVHDDPPTEQRGDTYGPPADVTVVLADGPEVDRTWVAELVRRDLPHLIVRTTGDTATVGPFVLPGSTSCLRCHDLLRRDRDPSWPAVLAQLTRLDLSPPAPVVTWAAAYASVQLLAWLSGGRIETAGSTVELNARDYTLDRRLWPTHPECGCRWTAPTEWGP